MKRSHSRPVIILSFPGCEAPRLLPFPGRGASPKPKHTNDELCAVRDRLFRMIVANEWDRSHGNRAS